MVDPIVIFDRHAVRTHRARAAARIAAYDFLFREVGERLADRLSDIKRTFPVALDMGCRDGVMASILGNRGGIETLFQCDLSPVLARAAARNGHASLAGDEEALPFAPDSFDLVLGNLNLHWVNDLPGALLQLRQCLKPDGLLLAAMLGGRTLHELRACLMEAELAEEGGASPRVSPFADIRDVGALMQRAGFALPVVDVDTIPVSYPNALAVMRDLRGMGEMNAVAARRKTLSRRATLLHAAALYEERFKGPDGRLNATFEVIYMTGWAPAASQPRPVSPGSAKVRLADALESTEHSTGDPAKPA